MDLSFLQSNRFWFLILGSASAVLVDPNFPTQPWYISVGKFLGLVSAGFTVIRTVDRYADKSSNVSVDKANVVTSNSNDSTPSL